MANHKDKPWNDLTDHLLKSSRKITDRKVGIEVERIGLWPDGLPLRYHSHITPSGLVRPGISNILKMLSEQYSWPLVKDEGGHHLGLNGKFGKISLEPGCQVELSTNTADSLPEIVRSVSEFETPVNQFSDGLGLHWVCIGVNPLHSIDDIELIPYRRYEIMTEYLRKKGRLGLSMMRLTSSVQINLDYSSEEEAIDMLRTALAIAPVSYALFANSPLAQSSWTGFLSYRQEIWRNTDPERTGLLPEVFEKDFDFESYARLVWERPMMYAQKEDSSFVPANGMNLFDLQKGKIPQVQADLNNQVNSLQQLFYEARLKPGYIEVRSVDGRCPRERYAASAFWLGILYSPEARELALEKLGKISPELREQLFLESARRGLDTKVEGISLKQIAEELARAANKKLVERGLGEEKFLEPVFSNLEQAVNPAQRKLIVYLRTKEKNPANLISLSGRG